GPCKCPAGMVWQEDSNIKDGGYCKCSSDIARTEFINAGALYGNGTSDYWQTIIGRTCCPVGTQGYQYNKSSNTNPYRPGYNGAAAQTGCFCPSGTGPRTNNDYQGSSINDVCACPTGTNWYEGSGCLKCPPGSTWDENCGQCLCDAKDQYNYSYGVYNQTNSCTQRQFNVPGAYYSTMTCSAGCTMEAHYFDAGMNCCYCAAQAGANHDDQHDARGCLIRE
ncbi:MAG: hypothetical protein II972_02105, partial [Elusimicrobiaceae bacterium]|nr:hypothetical protein [Elusimicrobiaceae bacterium]